MREDMDAAQQRREAHAILDVMNEQKLSAVRNLLEFLVEPLSCSLAQSPIEHEESRWRRQPRWTDPATHSAVVRAFLTKK